ncbi:hypothetical protein vseg_019685 [Gypsophila vaccaria]
MKGANTEMEQQEANIIGPDLFGFYKREIVDHLTQTHDDFPPLTNPHSSAVDAPSRNTTNNNSSDEASLFSNSLEDAVPAFKRDLLKASLRQGVAALAQEVDEMIDPVMRIRHILACLDSKTNKSLEGEAVVGGESDSTAPPSKKQKTWSLYDKENLLAEQSGDAVTETSEEDEDLKLLLQSNISVVEEIMTKQSNEHYATLNHMELQLEELLGAVTLKCRPMTCQEKHQLQMFIQELPTRNLDRVVEIIGHGKLSDTSPGDEIVVDLEEQDNATLWRLYFYSRAVENARKLAS